MRKVIFSLKNKKATDAYYSKSNKLYKIFILLITICLLFSNVFNYIVYIIILLLSLFTLHYRSSLRAVREPPRCVRFCLFSPGLAFPARLIIFRYNQLVKKQHSSLAKPITQQFFPHHLSKWESMLKTCFNH